MKLENEIWAYGLKNAIEHNGKAVIGKVLPKLFLHGLDRNKIADVMPVLKSIVEKINDMSEIEQKELFEDYKKFVKETRKRREGLAPLPNAGGKMVFRLAPFPSGALHIGNAKTFLINALYAEKYHGKILLVMDDTIGSEEKQLIKEAYTLITDAFSWLGIKYEKPIIYKSDRLKIYYDYAEKLIKKGKAYVCHCSQKKLRENRERGIECSCRQFPPDVQLKRWKDMFKLPVGKAVLRIKTNMLHPNPAFRDRVLFKISDRTHPRVGKKYRVWPTLEMSWAIDDHLLGITHIIRGQELRIETEMEKFIWDIFGWEHPETIHTGALRLEGVGAKISKSKAQKEVLSGKFIGWDDPRTWSIQSLKRRGFLPETLREFVKEIGLNKQDITVPIDAIYTINRRFIDKIANRFSFVRNPVKLKFVEKIPYKNVNVRVHPEKKEMKKLSVGEIYISEEDYKKNLGKEVRLLHLCNIQLGKHKDASYLSDELKDIPKINWVSKNFKARILMPDGKWIRGLVDESVSSLKKGDLVQFERFGFCRLDDKKNFEFWFTHK